MKPYSILNNLIFLNIETTGIDPISNKVIEIGAIKIRDKVVTKFNTLVNPNISVPLNKGILQEELDTAP
jgi:ATP-dependent DNA helicase DinG